MNSYRTKAGPLAHGFSLSEKLARHGSSALSSREHLGLVVGNSLLAETLLRRFGSIKALRRASCAELLEFVPKREAEALVAALSLVSTAETEAAMAKPLDNGAVVYGFCQDMRKLNQEVLRVILVDTSYRCITTVDVTKGTLNETLASPREVLRPAIVHAAYAFVLVHNHPSGDVEPSDGDIRTTRKIVKCARLFEIHLVDHVIVGDPGETSPGFFSFKDEGLI
jgi:DNA repair protein RadC